MANRVYEYRPDYAIHPGEYIAELLEAKGMKQTELALRLGVTTKHLNNIINGKAQITPEMAKSLQNVFNYPSKYWLSLQATFDVTTHENEIVEKYKRNKETYDEWLKQFDYKNLVALGYVHETYAGNTSINRINNLLSFFACSDIDSWNKMYCSELPAACRITGASAAKLGNTTAWIRRGQILAQQKIAAMPEYNKAAFKAALLKIRDLTLHTEDGFDDQMVALCHEAGICLTFAREIPRSGICGAAFWMNNGLTPCIQMSLRFKKNDHFWFTFFHEAAHILKEHKKIVFLDCDKPEVNDIEEDADQISRDFLIPKKQYLAFVRTGRFYEGDIRCFAASIGVHPGIVVGRLQHDRKIEWKWHNKMKESFNWAD